MAQVDPGWYPDPAGSPAKRWWDGETWGPYAPASPVGHAAGGFGTRGAKNGLATASLTLGIIGLCLSWIPYVASILAIVALALGIFALRRSSKIGAGRGKSIWGLSLGAVALVLNILLIAGVASSQNSGGSLQGQNVELSSENYSVEFCSALQHAHEVAAVTDMSQGVPPEGLEALEQLAAAESPNQAIYQRYIAVHLGNVALEDDPTVPDDFADAMENDTVACFAGDEESEAGVDPQSEPFDPVQFSEISERDFALIAKDPAGHVNEKIIVYGVVTQADSNTGPCRFRADTGAVLQEHNYLFDENTFVYGLGAETCDSIASNVVKGDRIRAWVRVLGTEEYNVQTFGGSRTALALQAWQVEVLPSE